MFTAPLFLIAAALGALIPLALHAFQNNRKVTVPFPTLRFLKMADKQSSRRARMEYVLLWLLRTLIMILLGLAFAMPTLRLSNFSWLGDSPRDVALVIDVSYSMGYRKTQNTVWDENIACATALLEGLGEKDRFCIYLAGANPIPLFPEPVADIEEALVQLNALKPTTERSEILPALRSALDAMKEDVRGRQQEVYILTDNQALPWRGFAGQEEGGEGLDAEDELEEENALQAVWDPERIGSQTSVYVVQLGVDQPENVGLAHAALNPTVLFANTRAQLRTELIRTGAAAATTITLSINGKEIGRRSVMAGGEAGVLPEFAIPAMEPGMHIGLLETPDDNLDADNRFHFLLQVKEKVPSLCVGTEEDGLFVRAALKAGEKTGLESKWIPPDDLGGENLHAYSAVFLCNALPLPGGALDSLESYVRSGGLVMIFPGDKAMVQDYQAMPWLPGQPVRIQDFVRDDRKKTLAWTEPQHPLVQPLRTGLATPNISVRRSLVWEEIADSSTRLISMGPDEPFLLDRPLGRGRVLLCAVAADRVWGELPLSPFFLPIVHQVVSYGSGIGAYPSYSWSEPFLPLGSLIPGATRASVMTGPDDRPIAIRSQVVEGRSILQAEDLRRPGIYTMALTNGDSPTPVLAVNFKRDESDLSPISAEQIKEMLGGENLYVAADKAELLRLVQEHRIGRSYGELLLWLAFLLVIVEFMYANRLAKGGSSLLSLLGIGASGNLKGGAV